MRVAMRLGKVISWTVGIQSPRQRLVSTVPNALVWSAKSPWWSSHRHDQLNRLAPAHSSHTSSLCHSTSLLATNDSDQGEAGGQKRGETDNSDDEGYCICINVCSEERDVKDYFRDIEDDPSNAEYRYIYDYSWEGLEDFANMYWGENKCHALEYLDLGKRRWKSMMDIHDLDQFKFKRSDELSLDTPVAHFRLPWRWESAREGLNYLFGQGVVNNRLENAIYDLVDELKEEGFQRSSDKPFTFVNAENGAEISTKEWVLKRARPQTILRSLILGQVGALDHIVESLHYDIVWNVVNFRGSSNWPDPAQYWIRDMSSKEYKG